jgi:choline kinase
MMKPTLLILAAGIGSRYGGVKQMDGIGPSGESIIDYSIYDAIKAGFGKVVFVINRKIEADFKEVFEKKLNGKIKTEYVLQEITTLPEGVTLNPERTKPWGTAHAVLVAKDKINEPFAVINADDFYGSGAFKLLKQFFDSIDPTSKQYAMVGYELAKTLSENGTVSRGICTVDNEDYLQEVVEHTKIKMIDNNIGFDDGSGTWDMLSKDAYVSMNFWGFNANAFEYLEKGFETFLRQNANELKAEYYIPLLVSNLIESEDATVRVLKSKDQWFGVTYKEDKPTSIKKINKLIEEGSYPSNLWG